MVTWGQLVTNPALFVACGAGSGLSPVASGTIGTLFSWLCYAPLRVLMTSEIVFATFLLLMFALGVICCELAGRYLGMADHDAIVWDEIVPFWALLWLVPDTIVWQSVAFLLFRLFDIAKPWPCSYFDLEVKNGFGVMMDDLVAAFYAVLCIAVAKHLDL